MASTKANSTPSLVQPGCVFVIKTGSAHGHMGLVEQVAGVGLTTIEGTTNLNGSPEGIGFFRRTGRTIGSMNLGSIQY